MGRCGDPGQHGDHAAKLQDPVKHQESAKHQEDAGELNQMDGDPVVAFRVLGEDHRIVVVVTGWVLVRHDQGQQKTAHEHPSNEPEQRPFGHPRFPLLSIHAATLPSGFYCGTNTASAPHPAAPCRLARFASVSIGLPTCLHRTKTKRPRRRQTSRLLGAAEEQCSQRNVVVVALPVARRRNRNHRCGWARVGKATSTNHRRADPGQIGERRRLAGKTWNSQRPPQTPARNHNPKAPGSSPGSGIA